MTDAQPSERPLDPEKLLRIASLTREVLEEVRRMDPDEHTSTELASLHKRVTAQLHEALTPELIKELEAIDLDLHLQDGPTGQGPTGQEVRIAFAGLIGWLGGLFQGLQAAIQVQAIEAAAQAQRALAAPKENEPEPRTGRYL